MKLHTINGMGMTIYCRHLEVDYEQMRAVWSGCISYKYTTKETGLLRYGSQ